jgi:hypothetical protein
MTGVILQWSVSAYAAAHGLAPQHIPSHQAAAARVAGYQINLASFAVAYVIAMLLWLRIDSTQPVTGGDGAAHAPGVAGGGAGG